MMGNTAETLSRGMSILVEQMGIVEAEKFLFLVKTERFDYTEWQRDYFDGLTREALDEGMDTYFKAHPYSGEPTRLL